MTQHRLTLVLAEGKIAAPIRDGGCSSAWLEPQIVDLVVAGSNPVSHPILHSNLGFLIQTIKSTITCNGSNTLFIFKSKSPWTQNREQTFLRFN